MQISSASSMHLPPAIDVATLAARAAEVTTVSTARGGGGGVSTAADNRAWIIHESTINTMNHQDVATMQRVTGVAA